ncbi:hypothetical protein AB6I34_000011 [Salmonella enterica]
MTRSPYQGAFLALLPTGKAWNKQPSGTLGRLTDSDEGQYTTVVNVLNSVSYRNATVLDNVLTPLRVYDSGALECLLEKYKPAHQIYKFIYADED